jgi:hypothetical protein
MEETEMGGILHIQNFENTGVPPYPLIQYPRFTAARKKLKLKK